MGWGFLEPKNAEGVVARETEVFREKDRGLALEAAAAAPEAGVVLVVPEAPEIPEAPEGPPGVKVLAAGLGLNSMARTLNFDAAEGGFWAFAGLVIRG